MITIELKKGELLWGGRVHEGTEPPEYCPVCGQPRGAFRPI